MSGGANAITITWTLGIGLGAIVAAYLMMNENTKKWSDNRIVLVSLMISFSVVLAVLQFV